MNNQDASSQLVDAIKAALSSRTLLEIRGGNSKQFLSQTRHASTLDSRDHRGILHLDTDAMSIRARAGTPLAELNHALYDQGLMLAFEPPAFSATATVGGMVACGLAGPRRPWVGSVGEHLLGGKLIDGLGQQRGFGIDAKESMLSGETSQLLAGSFGRLGLITEVCLKVRARPLYSQTLRLEIERNLTLHRMKEWGRYGSPISAFCHTGDALYLRLEGSVATVRKAIDQLGGLETNANLWEELREHRLAFFRDPRPLWRLSLPEEAPVPPKLPGTLLLEWCGTQYWLKSDAPAAAVRRLAEQLGGYASSFTAGITELPLQHNPATRTQAFLQLQERLDPYQLFGLLTH